MFNLEGKIATITGCTRGIGREIAISLARAGANIALLQRDVNNKRVLNEIEKIGRKCVIIPCDLNDLEQVKNAVPNTLRAYGELHILVNSGGVQHRAPSISFSEEAWDQVIKINLKSTWLLCQAAGKYMIEKKYGKIINVASLLSFQGGYNVPAYAASKGGVAQLTKALSNEWASCNINVNAIVPGYIATDMNTALVNDKIRSQQILERIPAGRWGKPEDFAGTAVYLASDASNYVHGHMLAVDGGWLGR